MAIELSFGGVDAMNIEKGRLCYAKPSGTYLIWQHKDQYISISQASAMSGIATCTCAYTES